MGDFPCKVIVEINSVTKEMYSLILDDALPFLNDFSQPEYMRHQTAINLLPGQIANIGVRFAPEQAGSHTCRLKMHVMYNPFEVYVIDVSGDCFVEDVILENLPTCSDQHPSKSSFGLPEAEPYCTNYIVDFGNSYLNDLQKMRFRIINRSEKDMYKFEFKSVPEVVFTPTVGHLRAGTRKEIIMTFLSADPVSYKVLL